MTIWTATFTDQRTNTIDAILYADSEAAVGRKAVAYRTLGFSYGSPVIRKRETEKPKAPPTKKSTNSG